MNKHASAIWMQGKFRKIRIVITEHCPIKFSAERTAFFVIFSNEFPISMLIPDLIHQHFHIHKSTSFYKVFLNIVNRKKYQRTSRKFTGKNGFERRNNARARIKKLYGLYDLYNLLCLSGRAGGMGALAKDRLGKTDDNGHKRKRTEK